MLTDWSNACRRRSAVRTGLVIAACLGYISLQGVVGVQRVEAAVSVPLPPTPAQVAADPAAYPKLYLQTKPIGIPSGFSGPCPLCSINGGGNFTPNPVPSNAYYALYNDLTDPNHTVLQAEGNAEPQGSLRALLEIGGPCSSTSVQTYGSGAPCLADSTVAYDVEWFMYGYAVAAMPNQPHYGAGDVHLAVVTNNSHPGGQENNNGADLFNALESQTYQYASSLNNWAATFNNNVRFYVDGGSDIETQWDSPTAADSLPLAASFNSAWASSGISLAFADNGAMYSSCASASCWTSPSDHGWTMEQIYDANSGSTDANLAYVDDVSWPEIYDSQWPAYYADMDNAAIGAGQSSAQYDSILFGCSVGNEPTPAKSEADFAAATGIQTDVTSMHALGSHSTTGYC
jgi:hypothetical protein